MTIETLMWSFAIVFMLHEFEEIIMLKPWLERHGPELSARFPRAASRIIGQFGGVSTSAIAFAILEEFVVLAIVILLCVAYGAYDVWSGVVTGYTLHTVAHLGQFAAYRKYCPFVFTSILSVPYGTYCLLFLYRSGHVSWQGHLLWTVIAIFLIAINLRLAHRLATLFDRWLKRDFGWAHSD